MPVKYFGAGSIWIPCRCKPKREFFGDLDSLMGMRDHQLSATVILKEKQKEKYGPRAYNPYSLSLEFCIERLLQLIENREQKEVLLVADARGKNEDKVLLNSFNWIMRAGGDYLGRSRLAKIPFRLEFKPKSNNLIGHQIGDLAAYPIVRPALDKKNEQTGLRDS